MIMDKNERTMTEIIDKSSRQPRSGRGGRRFESSHSDQSSQQLSEDDVDSTDGARTACAQLQPSYRSPTKTVVLKRMAAVRKIVEAEIRDNSARGGMFARGLSSEGFAGGYLQAIDDIEAALRHGYPSDHRGYWRKAEGS